MSFKDHSIYNSYMNSYMKDRWKKRRAKAVEYLGGKCKLCNETENLQFDHIDYREKEFTIASGSSYSEERFWKEVDKCQLLCDEHHRYKTLIANDPRGGGYNRVNTYDHGSGHMYNKKKCRCESCAQWRRDYRKKLVDYRGKSLYH